MDDRLTDREFLAGDFSIADMACWPWIRGYKAYGIDLKEFKNLRAWFKCVGGRPAVERAANIGKDEFRERQKRAQGSI
jgi:GST-like protein